MIKSISSLLAVREMSLFVSTCTETHSGLGQASKKVIFVRLVSDFKLKLLTTFARSYIGDVSRGPELMFHNL